MKLCSKLKATVFALALTMPAITAADNIEYDASLSLKVLTEKVYQRLPATAAEAKFQQLQLANEQQAQHTFAGPAVANISHFNDAIGSGNGLQEWESSVDLPLWLPGQKQQQLKLAKQVGAQLPAYQQYLKWQASALVRQLIWDIKLAETSLQQASTVWQTAQKLEHDVDARVKAGDLPNTERLLARSHTMEAKSQVLAAQSQLNQKLKDYQLKTGEQVLPAEINEALSAHNAIDDNHPLLQLHDQQIAVLQSEQAVARFDGQVNPNVSVGMRRERGDNHENFNHSIGLGFSMALDNNRYSQAAVAEVSAKLTDAQVARQQTASDLHTELTGNLQTLTMQQEQLELLKAQDDTTQTYLDLQKRAFDLGEINLMTLLQSQVVANESHSRLKLLEVEVQRSVTKVNQTLGDIL